MAIKITIETDNVSFTECPWAELGQLMAQVAEGKTVLRDINGNNVGTVKYTGDTRKIYGK